MTQIEFILRVLLSIVTYFIHNYLQFKHQYVPMRLEMNLEANMERRIFTYHTFNYNWASIMFDEFLRYR